MSESSPHYQPLTTQVAKRIVQEVKKRTWVGKLPNERALAASLQISRKTLRKALSILRHEGLITADTSHGHRIVGSPSDSQFGRASSSIGLLTPDPIEQLRPFTALWMDELRSLLFSNGIRLDILSGHRYFSQNPGKAIARLNSEHPHTCWVLAHSNERVQQWYHDNHIPCLIAGSCHPGLDMPYVDLDYFAVCRHAVGAMLRKGHRRLAMLTKLSQRAGDLQSEAGFSAGTRQPAYSDISSVILRHDGTVESVNYALKRMFDLVTPPTVVLVANPAYYLTALTFLAQRGLKVPADVSLISRDDDVFLPYVNPVPTRYSVNPKTFAKRLLIPLLQLLRGENPARIDHHIEAQFISGKSLGPAADGTDKG
jgi:DNA-binding LacI/PurR family transcriptional regulator